jgi:N-acetylglucosaminyldiphosphoundecaprenol N-acetyl-beta-D-mannosaminyltransferase
MLVDCASVPTATEKIIKLALHNTSSYVCVSNVHMCMEVFDSQDFAKIVNKADLVVADGRPIFWAQRLLGFKDAQQVRGQDLMNALCARSGRQNLKIGLYGGFSTEILESVTAKLREQYTDIQIVYQFSPPFRPITSLEDSQVIKNINESGVNVLFVGIGCPKQERWMFDHKPQLACVMLGVGAAFDFISGSKKHAPTWVQKAGFEWLFRLISEPKRLWKRYLKQNPRFVYYFLQQWLFKKDFTKEGPKDV